MEAGAATTLGRTYRDTRLMAGNRCFVSYCCRNFLYRGHTVCLSRLGAHTEQRDGPGDFDIGPADLPDAPPAISRVPERGSVRSHCSRSHRMLRLQGCTTE